jgi:hypothetical protein
VKALQEELREMLSTHQRASGERLSLHQLTKLQAEHGVPEEDTLAVRPTVSISLQNDQPMTDLVEWLYDSHHYSGQQMMSDGMNAKLAEFQEGNNF